MVNAHKKAKDTEESKLLPELKDLNRKARTSKDPEKVQEFHKACSTLVKRMGKEGGVVGNAFRELEYAGKGKPGDEICKLTGRYSRKVLKEESSSDTQDVIATEKLEVKIRTKAEERRLEEKTKERQYGTGGKKIELAKEGIETPAGIVKLRSKDPPLHIIKDSPEGMKTYEVVLKPPDSPEKIIGSVIVKCWKVADFKNSRLYGRLIENKLNDQDRFINLLSFYPYPFKLRVQLNLPEPHRVELEIPLEYRKKGIGTAAMSQLFKDFKLEGFAGVIGDPGRVEMIDFMKKRFGFQDIGENTYFKKL
jgi:hypothetical protein